MHRQARSCGTRGSPLLPLLLPLLPLLTMPLLTMPLLMVLLLCQHRQYHHQLRRRRHGYSV